MARKLQPFLAIGIILAFILGSCSAPQAATPTPGLADPAPAVEATFGPVAPTENAALPQTSATEPPTPGALTPAAPASGTGAVRYEIVPEKSEARYRVREQLANFDLPSDAIGKTQDIHGAIVLNPDGSLDPAESRFVVNLSTLQSDRSQRDNFVRRNTLKTAQFPEAVFVPTRVSGLPAELPQSGDVSFQLTGDLTLLEVTKEVTWEVTGSVQDSQVTLQASTSFTFADFKLDQPRVPVVLSVEDTIKLELDLTLRREGDQAAAPAGSTQAVEGEAASSEIDCSSPAALTPAMTEGPYYKAGAPERTSLLEEGIPGTRLLLSGYVLTQDCQPVAGARLDFWQTDGNGEYDNAGYRMRGFQLTDESGRFILETVMPGIYPGRTEHIHVKVQAPGGPVLTSQLFFPGVQENETDSIFSPQLLVKIQDGEGGKVGTFNFVVETR